MKDFSKINTHHKLKVYGKLKYDVWHTVVHKFWILYIFFHFPPHNHGTYLKPKATISIVICCDIT